ncbi:MAG TPA: hypothetical protein VJP77_06460, partial [Planctomycetota bacterium]|nr:hypothetical protein [Planctomycetota bacterium]
GLGVASVRLGPVVPVAGVAERASLRLRSDGALERYAALLDPLAEACARWDALLAGGVPAVHEVWILEDRSTFESLRETILRDRAHRGLKLRLLVPSVFPAFESADDVLATPGHVVAWGGASVASLRQPLLLALARDAVRGRAPRAPDWLVQGLVDYEAERLAEESLNPFDTDLYGRMRGELAATGSLTKLVSGSPWTDEPEKAVEAHETRRAAGLVAAHLFLASDGDGRAALGALLDAYASGADPSAALVERLGEEGVVRLDRLFSDERLRLADPLRR